MTDWIVFDHENDEPLVSFPTNQQAKDQAEAIAQWMDDYYRGNDEDPHEYEVVGVVRMERVAQQPVRVWTSRDADKWATDELWWPWNVNGFPPAERIAAGEVVEWAPGMFRGLDKQAVEAAAFRAKEGI